MFKEKMMGFLGKMGWILILGAVVVGGTTWWYWSCWAWWNNNKKKEIENKKKGQMMATYSSCSSSSSGGGNTSINSNSREGRRIPRGSMGWPLIGETLDFIACGYSSRPVSFMEKRRALYGKIFKSHLLGKPIIVSTDAGVNRAVLQDDGAGFAPCYPESVTELLGESSILRTSGDLHRRVHGLIGGFLKSPAVKARMTGDIQRSVVRSLRGWEDGRLVHVQDMTKKITFQVLVKVLMSIGPGEELDFLKKEFGEFIQGLICLPIKLPGTRLCKSLKAKERMLKLVKKIVEDRIRRGERGSVGDVVDVLLNEIKDAKKKQWLSIDSICGIITEMMIPGEDSVPMLMTLAVKFLSDSPIALKQLMVENLELKKEKDHMGKPYVWADYMSLPFTQNVINETLRMSNIINGVWRKALKDMDINGYLIPKDWCILASFSSIHLDEENYKDPYEFNPWRWQRKDGISQTNFTPFGGGHRLCPGLELARLEVSIFLHHLVTNYSWVAEEDFIIHFPTVKMRRRLPITVSAISN